MSFDYKAEAKRVMTHYITLVMTASGLNVDGDTYAELNDVVDNIIEAAKVEMREALDARPQCQWFHYSGGEFDLGEVASISDWGEELQVYMRQPEVYHRLRGEHQAAFKAAWAEYQAA